MKNDGPKINVFNRQRKIGIELESLKAFLVELSGRLGLQKGFSVALVSDQVMQRFNAQFAGKSAPTDVLSFPAGQEGEPYLGDIVISVESADRQRRSSLDTEMKILGLHGVLHLIGYDHVQDDGEMGSLECALRKEFGLE